MKGGSCRLPDLGGIEADAVPARRGGLRLRVVVEGDGAVVELRELQRLPPSFTKSVTTTELVSNFTSHHP